MTHACVYQDKRKTEGSDVRGYAFVAVRESHDDAGSHRGYVDVVFCITQKMTGAAEVGDGEGKGGLWDDVVSVKIIN